MLASSRWLNDYLDPPATPDEQATALTMAGVPVESTQGMPDGDTQLDVELTSNRGDCLSHLGLAREIAAVTGRQLIAPDRTLHAEGESAVQTVTVTNHEPTHCPRYTARLIRGVQVGPSPDWLQDRLRAIGQIPRNNIVDATNYVLFEYGQPTHVFDLATLNGPAIHIRFAKPGESFLPLGEGEKAVTLSDQHLVIADEMNAVALAGVKGGATTAVTNQTTDLLLEAATFAPATVRKTSRSLRIDSASSYRFERGVHPASIDQAADRLAELILELAGGTLAQDVVEDGATLPSPDTVRLRCDRCRALLGVSIEDATIIDLLARLGLEPKQSPSKPDEVVCTIPFERMDLSREADLIEEVGRMFGHQNIPVGDTIPIRVAPQQSRELARRAVGTLLVGAGYFESVTHTLISERAATLFIADGDDALRVDDERAKADPILRPSTLPSLCRVLAHNRANGVRHARLFETAATFTQSSADHTERVQLGLLHPGDDADTVQRELRGVIDRLATLILGPTAQVEVRPSTQRPWYAPGATLLVGGDVIGHYGALADSVRREFDLDGPIFAAELTLPAWYDRYPPDTTVEPLPTFPGIERDISIIIDESTPWAEIAALLTKLGLEHVERVEFVTAYRGRQIGAGRKSITIRLGFRAPDRTLLHDEVDPQVELAMRALADSLHAEIRR